MTIYDYSSYRDYLKQMLINKINENPRYSLRAMAQRLEMGPSTLSEVLSGRTNLSQTSARRIADKLKLKAKESGYFFELVSFEAEKNPEAKSLILERLRQMHPKKRQTQDLSIEHFKQMAEWHHSAILELPQVKGFAFTPENISRALGISKLETKTAIARLLKLGLLEEVDGQIQRQDTQFRVQSDVKNIAMRKYYRQMLTKISEGLESQTPQERLSGYLNLAIDEKALPEVDQAIDRLFMDIKNIAAKYPEKTSVYHLSLHFMNLIKKEN